MAFDELSEKFIAAGRRVVAKEAEALLRLADDIGDSFFRAAEILMQVKGRVIVSGMGKSGHIARKIAGTLASTGTPAHFVHPAEASHGDLGMIARGDAVLLLSSSGETPELADMIAYTRRFSIPLVGIAKRADSTLLQRSDAAIVLPPAEEACETGIVPTTSTTLTLALGDALAIAIMEHREFTPELFKEFHPGGRLGARLSKVRDLMHGVEKLPLVDEATPMPEALLEITGKGFGIAGVTSIDGRLVGVITDGDLRRNMNGLLERRAADVMTCNPLSIEPDALAQEALALMNERKITCLFAVDPANGGIASGLLHIHDCLRAGIA
ncbi:MAG: KpsF/GutQ family sugar-phosphate isomerase [Albidovulum sp.]|nr:KpsF/GutQ family sugar-phosphate isomerase [Albidovulum sp.]